MSNTRVQKRKNNAIEVKNEPPKKALKKNEIIAEFNILKDKFENLQEEKRVLLENQKTHIEAISLLEETVTVLESKLASRVESHPINISVQTEIIRCEECEYPAEDMHDLVDHMHGAHPLENEGDVNRYDLKCQDCEYPAEDICDLGSHIFKVHSSENFDEIIKCRYCQETFNGKGD